jgi:uncharacterized membrane protein
VNSEQGEYDYRVEVKIDGLRVNDIKPLTLTEGQKWEGKICFASVIAGENQNAAFLLYKRGYELPSKELHLWIDVK